MKSRRFASRYRQNASKLHKRVGDILQAPGSPFRNFKIYQEYPVSRVNPEYHNNSHKFDWVILDLYLVIEAHGEQHYNPVAFGGMDYEEATECFLQQRHRDNSKMDAAVEAGFTYIVIPYHDYKLVDADYIWNLYQKCYNPNQVVDKKEQTEETEYQKYLRQRAREYRQELYRRRKQCLDKYKCRRQQDGFQDCRCQEDDPTSSDT